MRLVLKPNKFTHAVNKKSTDSRQGGKNYVFFRLLSDTWRDWTPEQKKAPRHHNVGILDPHQPPSNPSCLVIYGRNIWLRIPSSDYYPKAELRGFIAQGINEGLAPTISDDINSEGNQPPMTHCGNVLDCMRTPWEKWPQSIRPCINLSRVQTRWFASRVVGKNWRKFGRRKFVIRSANLLWVW